MEHNKLTQLKTYLSILVMLLPALLMAQPSDPNDAVSGVPIDGGLSLLMAAGALYGAKKACRKGKRKQVEN